MADVTQNDIQVQKPDATQEDDQREVNRMNAVVGSHLKRTLPKHIEEALAPHLASIREMLTQKPEPSAKEPKADDGTSKKLDELQRALKAEREERMRERQEARETKAFADLRSELQGKVRPEAVDLVAKLLRADKLIQVTEDGTAVLKLGDVDHSLSDGVAKWLKSRDAAMFLPAPGYPGNGQKKPGKPVPGRTAPDGKPINEDPLTKTQRQLEEIAARQRG